MIVCVFRIPFLSLEENKFKLEENKFEKDIIEEAIKNTRTRLPRAVPQPLFFLLIVFGCIIFFRSSSIFKNIEVIFHISSSWVGIKLHTKNQVPRLHGSCLTCNESRCKQC